MRRALTGVGVLFVAIPFFAVAIAGFRSPLGWLENAETSAYASPAVNIIAPAETPMCHFPQDEAASFESCAAFWADFSTQKNGGVDKKIFNVFAGQPSTNKEVQLYVDSLENLRVENGALLLSALQKPQDGYLYTSARIDTSGKADFLYGKLVVRAKLPTGSGTWPAIWLLPSESKYANQGLSSGSPRHLIDGEIDIAETVGAEPNLIYGVTHTLTYRQKGEDRTYFNTTHVPDSHITFHDYGVEWTPTSITISVDGVPYFTYTKKPDADYRSWPFDQPFYLVINVALGGQWAGHIDQNALPATMEIQNIRYYPYIGQE